MTSTTALYRFYGAGDELLYIGITNSIPRRLDQHSDSKPWYTEARRITVEHHPTRGDALAAEMAAIKAERPKYNIQHNRGRDRTPTTHKGSGRWVFESLRSGHQRATDLYLYAELECSSVVDDVHELDGEGQLEYYVRRIRRDYPQYLDQDAVPIVWCVVGAGTFEHAPFQRGAFGPDEPGFHRNFLTYFSWPFDARTGWELDWFKLPVRLDYRFPHFAEALGWKPSPFEPTCPLTSIMASREGVELVHRQGGAS